MTSVLMWEVRTSEDQVDELVSFLLAHVDPAAEVFRSAQAPPRVVVIDPSGTGVPEIDPRLVARPPDSWVFERVPR